MPSLQRSDVHNFAAGPSPLPTPVLAKAAEGLLNYNGTGIGVCELSHRGKEFKGIIEGAEANLREILQVPESHAILFTQGGGTTQFSAVVLNLLAYHRLKHAKTHGDALYPPPALDYVVTGSWSSKAAAEAKRLIQPTALGQAPLATVNLAASTKNSGFKTLPNREDYKFSRDPAFVYYCENETINGVQFPLPSSQSTSGSSTQDSPLSFPFDLVPADTPLVADYSSSFISRPIPHIERHALIYAGAQKNLGPSGVTIIIIRKDLLVDTASATLLGGVPACPFALEYKVQADNASLYNTPPTFAIYVCALVLEYLQSHEGGIKGLEERNGRKAGKLYEAIERAEEKGKLRCIVKEKDARSWMNVVFEVVESADGDANEKKFLAGAEERGFRQLKGHRSVGGIRASLYNAVSEESVDALCRYIDEFSA